MEKLLDVFNAVKSDFCQMTTYKLRGDTIEIITPFLTLNNKFISVFIKIADGNLIVSDGGWINLNYYEVNIEDEEKDIIHRVTNRYKDIYRINITQNTTGIVYYYKTCKNKEELSSMVFDLANFSVGIINNLGFPYKEEKEKEEEEKQSFRISVNSFLSNHYNESYLKLGASLEDYADIRFNAMIQQRSKIHLITYITGSTVSYFSSSLSKSIVNFEISEQSRYNEVIESKIAIINDEATGYNPDKTGAIINLLAEKTSQEPIIWTEKEKILNSINL